MNKINKIYGNLGNWANLGKTQFSGVTPENIRSYKLGTVSRGEKAEKKVI